MSEAKQRLVNAWWKKGMSDLQTARLLINGSEPHLDTGVYHCQQAAEKFIKGWLTSQDVDFVKTHDLDLLWQSCIKKNTSFADIKASLELLTPLATEFRYPGDLFEPSQRDALVALEAAEKVCLLLERYLPKEI